MLNDDYKNKINISCPVEGVPSNAVSIVDSVAQEEFSLAELLDAQANLLCKVINPCISACDFKTIVQSIIRTMKDIIQKNNILEVKLRETLNFIQKEKISCLDYNEQFELLNGLNSVLESIGKEEHSLGHLIEELGNGVANIKSFCDFDEIKQINNLVIALMRLIIENNTILLRKLRTVIKLIEFIKCSDFDIFIKVKQKLICTIKILVNSIFKEENGLAKLIFGETKKINHALKMCLNNEDISELDSLITGIKDVICDKKRILEYKFSEIVTLLNTVGFSSCEIDSIMDHIKKLQFLSYENQNGIAKIIKDESKEVNMFIKCNCCNFDKLINFNICTTCILVTLLLNLNIGKKNKNKLNYDTCNCGNKSICKELNNIINLIH